MNEELKKVLTQAKNLAEHRKYDEAVAILADRILDEDRLMKSADDGLEISFRYSNIEILVAAIEDVKDHKEKHIANIEEKRNECSKKLKAAKSQQQKIHAKKKIKIPKVMVKSLLTAIVLTMLVMVFYGILFNNVDQGRYVYIRCTEAHENWMLSMECGIMSALRNAGGWINDVLIALGINLRKYLHCTGNIMVGVVNPILPFVTFGLVYGVLTFVVTLAMNIVSRLKRSIRRHREATIERRIDKIMSDMINV